MQNTITFVCLSDAGFTEQEIVWIREIVTYGDIGTLTLVRMSRARNACDGIGNPSIDGDTWVSIAD